MVHGRNHIRRSNFCYTDFQQLVLEGSLPFTGDLPNNPTDRFVVCARKPTMAGAKKQEGRSAYHSGKVPRQWRCGRQTGPARIQPDMWQHQPGDELLEFLDIIERRYTLPDNLYNGRVYAGMGRKHYERKTLKSKTRSHDSLTDPRHYCLLPSSNSRLSPDHSCLRSSSDQR